MKIDRWIELTLIRIRILAHRSLATSQSEEELEFLITQLAEEDMAAGMPEKRDRQHYACSAM
jgi:hypothetical protein